jgi:acid phosphatase
VITQAPYVNKLAAKGANMTHSYGVTHPSQPHGMHDCSIRTGDRWMKEHFDRYARWAPRHNSLLIVTFDENAGERVKPIFTVIVGAKVRPGVYRERLNHYRLLRTIEEAYGLPPLGRARRVRPLSTIWMS